MLLWSPVTGYPLRQDSRLDGLWSDCMQCFLWIKALDFGTIYSLERLTKKKKGTFEKLVCLLSFLFQASKMCSFIIQFPRMAKYCWISNKQDLVTATEGCIIAPRSCPVPLIRHFSWPSLNCRLKIPLYSIFSLYYVLAKSLCLTAIFMTWNS